MLSQLLHIMCKAPMIPCKRCNSICIEIALLFFLKTKLMSEVNEKMFQFMRVIAGIMLVFNYFSFHVLTMVLVI